MAEFVNPKLFLADCLPTGKGRGIFASAPLARGEIAVVANGALYEVSEWMRLPESQRALGYDVGSGQVMCPANFDELSLDWYMNHSCDPNVGCAGDFKTLVCMREVASGEELTMDYAMTDESDWWRMPCACGSELCRGLITGGDWRRPELQERYRGYFQGNIQAKIDGRR